MTLPDDLRYQAKHDRGEKWAAYNLRFQTHVLTSELKFTNSKCRISVAILLWACSNEYWKGTDAQVPDSRLRFYLTSIENPIGGGWGGKTVVISL